MGEHWFTAATANSACGDLARQVPWESTPLGPPARWPLTLRHAVELCLSTRFPMLVGWGPELRMVYNDGYRDLLGLKHPAALGAPFAEVWDEVWPEIGPRIRTVLDSGIPTLVADQPLLVDRSGFVEETVFRYSVSPLRDGGGVVRGVLGIAVETTDEVVSARRLATLAALSVALHGHQGGVEELVEVTSQALHESRDLAGAALYLWGDGVILPVWSTPAAGVADVDRADVESVARTGVATTLGRTLLAPLADLHGGGVVGVVALEAGTLRPFDDELREFLGLLASTVGTELVGTVRRLREVDDLRSVSDALQLAMLPDPAHLPSGVVRYRPADGRLSVGGDWFDVVALPDGRTGLVVGDCVGHGLAAAAVMGQLRSASRALLLENGDPGAMLDGLDRFARTLPGAEFATVFCGVLDEVRRTVTYSVAGHLPPLVVATDAVRWLDGARERPLTVSSGARPNATATVRAGDLLLLYTDGLVEQTDEPLVDGLRRLARVGAQLDRADDVEGVADHLLDAMLPAGVRDDVVLLLHPVR